MKCIPLKTDFYIVNVKVSPMYLSRNDESNWHCHFSERNIIASLILGLLVKQSKYGLFGGRDVYTHFSADDFMLPFMNIIIY